MPSLDAAFEWFHSPMWLWLMLPAVAVVVVDLLRRWGAASWLQRFAAAAVRTLVFAAFIVALADPRWHRQDDVAHVVFVVDRSASITDEALEQAVADVERLRKDLDADVEVGLVLFDGAAEIAVVPGHAWTLPTPIRASLVEATDLDTALALGMALIPARDAGELVLLSDGRATTSPSPSTLAGAHERGIKIHTLAVDPAHADAAVTEVSVANAKPRPGAAVEGHVVVEGAAQAIRGVLRVSVGDEVVQQSPVELGPGEHQRIAFAHNLDPKTEPGVLDISAVFVPNRDDPNPGNNAAHTTVVVGDPPMVRMFAGTEGDASSIARALRAERMDVQVIQVQDVDDSHKDLSNVDLVVLANVPAATIGGAQALGPDFLKKLARYVDNGGGLLVMGGPQSYDMGGYGSSELARVLPVKLDPVDTEIQSAAAIIIVLDRSGSMGATVGWSKTKMELADEGAAASVNLLRPFDRVGVMSVTETVRWEIRPTLVRDPTPLRRKVMRIRADGGGIYVYTGIEAAYEALDKISAPLKHVILFSDATDSEEKIKGVPFGGGVGPTCQDLARKQRSRGITTSVIGIGGEDDIDTPFLKELASAGGGRFYLTADATKLRGLFVEETERLVDTSLHEADFRPVLVRAHKLTEGIDYATAPMLSGYQEVEARPTAEVLLTGPEDHPILTTWRYGLGHVVAWASDAGPRWAQKWLAWPGYSKQWTQAARFALRTRSGDETAIEVEYVAGQARLRVARRDAHGLTLDKGAVRARLAGVGDGSGEIALSSIEPGLWQGEVSAQPGRAYTVEVVDEDDEVLATHTFAAPPPAERRHRGVDNAALDTIRERTGGQREPERLRPTLSSAVTTDVLHLWPFAILLALLLLPIDALLRRPARVV